MKGIKEIEVRYADTDQMGVVYHANYLIWFEMARTQLYTDLGFSLKETEEKGIIFPIREVNIKYMQSVVYGESIRVETYVLESTKIKTVYKQIVLNNQDQIKAEAIITVVCCFKDGFKLAKMDQAYPEVYEAYCNIAGTI